MLKKTTFRRNDTLALKEFLDRNAGTKALGKDTTSLSGHVLKRRSPITLKRRLLAVGIYAPSQLLEQALTSRDLVGDAAALKISPEELDALYKRVILEADPDMIAAMKREALIPREGGQMDEDGEEFLRLNKEWQVTDSILDRVRLEQWTGDIEGTLFLPPIILESVDLRPYLGPARNQASRGSCYAFGATAVVEGLEYLRDRRSGPRDLSEQMVFWYSKRGQLNSAGGGSCRHALQSYCDYGASEEAYFPYKPNQMSYNHAQVPAPDAAIDRARFYRGDEVVSLVRRDVDQAKEVLRSNRCIGFISGVNGWHSNTGTMTFPTPLDSVGPGSSHCTTIIGFADRTDLPPEWEGGYFILRNSWGRAHSPNNHMGPEYGGHLRMPYGWYRRYGNGVYTLADETRQDTDARKWRVAFFGNKTLKGIPAHITEAEELDFNWAGNSPAPGIPADGFSARFTQLRRLRPGWHRFRLAGNNGVRLWVDDRLVINRWWDNNVSNTEQLHYVSGGDHVLRVEYYEHIGHAKVSLQVTPVEFNYRLFPNSTLSGEPAITFTDTTNDVEWRHVPPVSSRFAIGRVSLRAEAEVPFEEGRYRFHAVHTGGCRIWINDQLVLDDWDGADPSGDPVDIASGDHQVRVEFKHSDLVPALDAGDIYRAALNFGWSDETWRLTCHNYPEADSILENGYPDPDSRYQMFRIHAFQGPHKVDARLDAVHNAAGEYTATDGMPLRIRFNEIAHFKNGIPGSDDLDENWLSAHLRRRVFIAESGRYCIRLLTDDANRLMVDGRQLTETHYIIGKHSRYVDIDLKAGIHEFAVEYCNTKWGGRLELEVTRADWTIDYFDGEDFNTHVAQVSLDRLDRIPLETPGAVGAGHWSARAVRDFELPVGRYRVYARGDDGIRARINNRTLIDEWTTHASTGYTAFFEHHGGSVRVELDYFQGDGAFDLDFKLLPDGFFGEYYRGVELDRITLPGGDKKPNPPHAYRFDNWIDFDWGEAPPIPRLGRNEFSCRWWGQVELPVGRWRIQVTADDGVRLYLDGRLLIDEWGTHPATTYSVDVDLVGRPYNLKLEYFDQTVQAVCKLNLERLF